MVQGVCKWSAHVVPYPNREWIYLDSQLREDDIPILIHERVNNVPEHVGVLRREVAARDLVNTLLQLRNFFVVILRIVSAVK